jgi:large subunit ribosomal protein L25
MFDMKTDFELTAAVRTQTGTAACRRLRRLKGQVPAILYGGKNTPPLSVSLDHKLVWHALENPAFHSHILTVNLGDTPYQAVLKSIQMHPFKRQVLHLDLFRVTASEKITLAVPFKFIGESVAPGIKQEGGVLSRLLSSIEVHCYPTQLPEFLEVDVSHLGLNEVMSLSHLSVPEGVEILALTQGEDRKIVTIHPPRVQTEATATTEADKSTT